MVKLVLTASFQDKPIRYNERADTPQLTTKFSRPAY